MRKKIIAGNWKMYTTPEEGRNLVTELMDGLKNENLQDKKVIVIPPALHVAALVSQINEHAPIAVGAQNCHFEKEGAFTGEISPRMLASIGASYVIIGHSERRQYFCETNDLLARKVKSALEEGLTPIYCCGETLEERQSERYFDVIRTQVEEGLFSLSAEELRQVVVAYEPVWAIGTGMTASPAQAQEIHAFIRGLVADKFGKEIADRLPILYGGSVKPNNAAELFGQQDIDGGLIGGASLKAGDFLAIIQSA